jgi:hypothetical protein
VLVVNRDTCACCACVCVCELKPIFVCMGVCECMSACGYVCACVYPPVSAFVYTLYIYIYIYMLLGNKRTGGAAGTMHIGVATFKGERRPFKGERRPFKGERRPFKGERTRQARPGYVLLMCCECVANVLLMCC